MHAREWQMRKIGRLAFLSAVTGVVFCAASVAHAAGALAVGKCDRYGWSYGKGSYGSARAAALSYCAQSGDTTCHVVATISGACAAFAVDGECGPQGWATGSSRDVAERAAIEACAAYGGENCTIRRWVCDGF